jgi:hypothetical protein
MNPYTGEVMRIRRDEVLPDGFEQIPGELAQLATMKVREAFRGPTEQLRTRVNLRSQHPLAQWAKKKRKAKLAAASRRRNRR